MPLSFYRLKLPRPYVSMVTHVEQHYAAEYGMPSTHATNSMVMPWYDLPGAGIHFLAPVCARALVVIAVRLTCLLCAGLSSCTPGAD